MADATGSAGATLGARVSWGVIVVGAVATLATGTMLWLLGLGVTLVAAEPSQAGAALVALAVIAVAVTLLGCAVGGLLAGSFVGDGRARLGALHGLLGAALAFLLVTLLALSLFGASLRAVGDSVGTAAQAAAGAAPAAGAAASTGGSLGASAERFLVGAGIGSLTSFVGAATWIFMGTWLVGLMLAASFGLVGAKRARLPSPLDELVEPSPRRPPSPAGSPAGSPDPAPGDSPLPTHA